MQDMDDVTMKQFPFDDKVSKQEASRHHLNKDCAPGSKLWTDGLICAFELVWEHGGVGSPKILPSSRRHAYPPMKHYEQLDASNSNQKSLHSATLSEVGNEAQIYDQAPQYEHCNTYHNKAFRKHSDGHWVPIGWKRISELVQLIQADDKWSMEHMSFIDGEHNFTVADVATPYWECPAGPTWWCHVAADNMSVNAWLSKAQWLHPAISVALRDESRLISDRMKYLLYEVHVDLKLHLKFAFLESAFLHFPTSVSK